jgi:hypothetical protein
LILSHLAFYYKYIVPVRRRDLRAVASLALNQSQIIKMRTNGGALSSVFIVRMLLNCPILYSHVFHAAAVADRATLGFRVRILDASSLAYVV